MNTTEQELTSFVEQYEQLEAEKNDIGETQKELKAQIKGRGFDMKAFMRVIALRKRDRDELAEAEAIEQLYRDILGL